MKFIAKNDGDKRSKSKWWMKLLNAYDKKTLDEEQIAKLTTSGLVHPVLFQINT
tara:strand:- start:328 stop:489 length:162 start_codon:yes stop_codon:yes gene_type:complete